VGDPTGISPDICQAIADLLKVKLILHPCKTQVEVIESVAAGVCGIGLVGSDPSRAKGVKFTPAYVELEASYLVPEGSAINNIAQVDQSGVRIASFFNSAYDLWLQRNLQRATLAHAESFAASYTLFGEQKLDALAGLRTSLLKTSRELPGSRVLDGQFTGIQQAIAVKDTHQEALTFLNQCVRRFVQAGLVASLIQQYQVQGLAAPLIEGV
jgi:polar amino acid transport system substrate-binding protein